MIYIALTGPPSVSDKCAYDRLLPSYVSRRQSCIVFGVDPAGPYLLGGSRCDSPELFSPTHIEGSISMRTQLCRAHCDPVLALRSPPTRGA
jgi:hypothetical protein